LVGCDRAPPEPVTARVEEPTVEEKAEPPAACIVPLGATGPTPKSSLTDCPADPDGRPTMPHATLRFREAPGAPQLDVEVATDDAQRAHGLMFRPTLADGEGMLFSWTEEGYRSFWMHNTCLALDMLFIDQELRIAGILEQVPPWNDAPRRVTCPSAHVLEVPAGYTRAHGIAPGQHIEVHNAP
jgi:uncharacterized membrane protein (UPF0127 family)